MVNSSSIKLVNEEGETHPIMRLDGLTTSISAKIDEIKKKSYRKEISKKEMFFPTITTCLHSISQNLKSGSTSIAQQNFASRDLLKICNISGKWHRQVTK